MDEGIRLRLTVGTAALALLSACGGGDGGGVASSGTLAAPGGTGGTGGVMPAPTPSPSPMPTPSPCPSPTPTPSPSPVASPTPTPMPLPTPTPAPTPTPSPSPSPSPSPTPSPTPTSSTPPPVAATPTYAAPVAPPAGYVITPSTQQPTRSANDTTEFRRNYGANEFVNALYALDHGYTGQGVTVGVVDDGVNTALSAFAGQIDTAASKDFGSVITNGVAAPRNRIGDADSTHGTPVAAIIAARRDDQGTVGYAPDARIAVLRVDDKDTSKNTDDMAHVTEAFAWAADKGLKLINASFTSGGTAAFGDVVASYASKTNGLVVMSAGNFSKTGPADTTSITAANRNAFLFVVSYNEAIMTAQAGLATYSNTAGSLADRTVTAPGTNVTTMVDGTIGTFSGTSSAAPVVTAFAATILSKWPQLTGQQAGQVILSTARPIGDKAIYGAGMVDFKAALSPVDPMLTASVTATPQSVAGSVMVASPLLNVTGIRQSLAHVTVLDRFGRDYGGSLAALVVQPEQLQDRWLRRRIAQMGSTTSIRQGPLEASFGFARSEVAPGIVQASMISGHLAAFAGRYGVHADWNGADSLQHDVMGLAPFAGGILAYVPQVATSMGVDRYTSRGKVGLTVAVSRTATTGATALTFGMTRGATDLRLSVIDEAGTIMGVPVGTGGLTLGRGARTAMVEAHRRLGSAFSWSVEGYGSLGVTRLRLDPASLVTGSSALIGSRFGLQGSAPLLGGLVSLGLAQPLRVESGSVRITAGSGYDLASEALTYASTTADVAGPRRAQVTAGYARGRARTSLRLGASRDLATGTTRALGSWTGRF